MNVFLQVLSVEPENKKLYLTRKKALVESSLPLFRTFADARPGRVSHGYIVCVKDFGCIVRFYNDVKGLVPLSELSSEPISRPEDVFYVGQVKDFECLLTFGRVTGLSLIYTGCSSGSGRAVGSDRPPKTIRIASILDRRMAHATTI